MNARALASTLGLLLLTCSLPACTMGAPDDESAGADEGDTGTVQQELTQVSCKETTATGYQNGNPFPITLVTVNGEKVERHTANAYTVMARAAANDGVSLDIVSGFRSMAEQQYLYHCYVTCSCNGCNLAAKPGYSNHQSGHALDLNTASAGVLSWLNNHGAHYGFHRTVPSEAWHWEWWGGGPGGGACLTLKAEQIKAWSDAEPASGDTADYRVCRGQQFRIWFELKDVGEARWVDRQDKARNAGERVRLAVPDNHTPDPLTGKVRYSVRSNDNPDVRPDGYYAGSGEPCNDHAKCRRTVFKPNGMLATAPDHTGKVTTRWRLRDSSPVWSGGSKGFGPTAKLVFQVVDCPDEGSGGSGNAQPAVDPGSGGAGGADDAAAEPVDAEDGLADSASDPDLGDDAVEPGELDGLAAVAVPGSDQAGGCSLSAVGGHGHAQGATVLLGLLMCVSFATRSRRRDGRKD